MFGSSVSAAASVRLGMALGFWLMAVASAHAQGAPPQAPQAAPAPQAPQAPQAAPAPQAPQAPQVAPAPPAVPPLYAPAPAPAPLPPPGAPQVYYPQPQYGGAYPVGVPCRPEGPPRPRVSRAMMVTGSAVFGASYGVALITGITLLTDEDCDNCKALGGSLMVPVLGPFIGLANSDNEFAPFMTVWGSAQAAGLALTIAGYFKSRRARARQQEWDRAHGFALDLGRGRRLALDVSVSPRLAGGRAVLQF